ncbi:MAG: hypothetical protein K8R88_08800 [Armatimonadetes bacterium]|nr:hypothetical protein [Armatimonadota bacterium]
MKPEAQNSNRGAKIFFMILAGLFVFRLIVDLVQIQNRALAGIGQIFTSAIFLLVPIIGLFEASKDEWSPKKALAFFGGGVALHVLCKVAASGLAPSFGKVALEALAMTGLALWCCGLGALVATLIKDKNLILPIAIFLPGFDAFVIFNPTSVTQQIMQKAPKVFNAVTYSVPTFGMGPVAQVGPADFFFLAMFFIVIHKYKMQSKRTLQWILPVLLVYLLIVLFLGGQKLGPIELGALPALVPIGITVILVNLKEFKMLKSEAISTAFVAAISVGLMAFGVYKAATVKPLPPAQPQVETR